MQPTSSKLLRTFPCFFVFLLAVNTHVAQESIPVHVGVAAPAGEPVGRIAALLAADYLVRDSAALRSLEETHPTAAVVVPRLSVNIDADVLIFGASNFHPDFDVYRRMVFGTNTAGAAAGACTA